MERLTIIDGCGNDELARCMNCGLEKAGSNLENCGMCEEGWQRALRRLAAYEDNGLTPEEIKNALDVNDIIPEINVTVDHIRDLLQAEQDGRLLSVAGYITASAAERPDVWVSVWVAAKGHNGVGLELMNALPQLTGAEVVACNNIRPKTCAFYRFLGWQAQRMPHYYRLAPKGEYRLAVLHRADILPVRPDLGLEKVETVDELFALGMPPTPHTPRKDTWYMRRRYFHYPHFRYDVWAVRENGRLLAYAVTRTVSAQDTGCVPVVRLVDFVGEDAVLPRIGAALDALLRREKAEYMDCYNAGIPAAVWRAAGFVERLPDDGQIIPNYLTPPLRENTEYYYFTNKPDNFVMFKADGDQDRPNLPAE